MIPASRRFSLFRAAVTGASTFVLFAGITSTLAAQTASRGKWSIKPRESLAWWQVEPNYGHLWATTCPGDPSWSAGESRSSGYNYRDEQVAVTAQLNSRIPLFPRGKVTPVCGDAVHGDISIADTVGWKGVSGTIVINSHDLTTGADFRDSYAHKAVLKTNAYPTIEFTIDSLTDVRVEGDTIRATALGQLLLIGKLHPKGARLVAWKVDGGLRVRGQIQVPAKDMTGSLGLSKFALNMGVVLGRWDTLYMGIDVVLKSPGTGA
jgi:YceI-like protein